MSIHIQKFIIILFVKSIGLAFCEIEQIDINSYDIEIHYDPTNTQVFVTAKLEIEKSDSLRGFDMLLNSNAKIESIKSEINNKLFNIPYELGSQDTLHLMLPSELMSEGRFKINFEYKLPIDSGYTLLGYEAIIMDRGHHWYPLISDKIVKYRLLAKVPKDYSVFAPGDLIRVRKFTEDNEFLWQSQIPLFKLSVVIAKSEIYREVVKKIGNKTIYFYSYTLDDETMEKIINEASNAFRFYSRLVGEYHHNHLTLIELPDFSTINISTGFIMFGPSYVKEFKEGNYDKLLLPIAHQWFAAGVFFQLFGKGFWFFQMSLAKYLNLMYLQETKGDSVFTEALNMGLKGYRETTDKDGELAILDVDFMNSPAKGSAIVEKGPYVLDKLRRQLGDNKWRGLIKSIYKNFKGRIFTYNDFKDNLSKYDKNGICVLMFEKMLSEKGLPDE